MDTKILTPEQLRNVDLPLVRVPDVAIPASLVSKGVEISMVVCSALPEQNSKYLTVLGILLKARAAGKLEGVHTLVEATSGNTGKVLAGLAQAFGIKNVVLVMESDVPYGKAFPGLAYGAAITPPEKGSSTIETARKLGKHDGWLNLDQYANPDGLTLHREFSGPKIVDALGGSPDMFVAPVGTAGSIGGNGEYFRSIGECEIVGVLMADTDEIPGMRDKGGMKHILLPWETYADNFVEAFTRESYYASLSLIRTTKRSLGPSSGTGYIGAVNRLCQREREGSLDEILGKKGKFRVVVFGPDGYEPYHDRYNAQVHRNHSKPDVLPLPWMVLPERYRSFRI